MSSSKKKKGLNMHSRGWKPRTPNDVAMMFTPKANEAIALIKPLCERSLAKYETAGREVLLSTYCGESILIVTVLVRGDTSASLRASADEVNNDPDLAPIKDWIDGVKAGGDTLYRARPFVMELDLDAKVTQG